MSTTDRLTCPTCGLPTIPDDGHNTPDMATCNQCYEREEGERFTAPAHRQATHTPGPWNVVPYLTPDKDDDPMMVYFVAAGNLQERYDNLPVDENEEQALDEIHAENFANARLIASAPDLLQMVRNLVDLASVRGRLDGYKTLLADARALIARAEGKEPRP